MKKYENEEFRTWNIGTSQKKNPSETEGRRYENEEFRTWNIRVSRNAYYVPDNRSAGANGTGQRS